MENTQGFRHDGNFPLSKMLQKNYRKNDNITGFQKYLMLREWFGPTYHKLLPHTPLGLENDLWTEMNISKESEQNYAIGSNLCKWDQ